jgi:hypothetical protein
MHWYTFSLVMHNMVVRCSLALSWKIVFCNVKEVSPSQRGSVLLLSLSNDHDFWVEKKSSTQVTFPGAWCYGP